MGDTRSPPHRRGENCTHTKTKLSRPPDTSRPPVGLSPGSRQFRANGSHAAVVVDEQDFHLRSPFKFGVQQPLLLFSTSRLSLFQGGPRARTLLRRIGTSFRSGVCGDLRDQPRLPRAATGTGKSGAGSSTKAMRPGAIAQRAYVKFLMRWQGFRLADLTGGLL